MRKLDPETFTSGMEIMRRCFRFPPFEKDDLDIWYAMLSELPAGLFMAAVFQLSGRSGERLHAGTSIPSAIWNHAMKIRESTHPSPEQAWGEVMEKVAAVGSRGNPSFADPMVRKAVDILGWSEMCLSGAGDAALRAHFYKTYRSLIEDDSRGVSRGITEGTEAFGLLERIVTRLSGPERKSLPEGDGGSGE